MILRNLIITALLSSAAAAQPAQDTRRKAERNLYEKVIEIPTVAGRGQVPRLIDLLSAELRQVGITDIQKKAYEGAAGDQTAAMIARWRAKNPTARPILLIAHLDVVEARRADWQQDPFEFTESEGYYGGRGVADNKAGVVAIIESLKRLKQSGFEPKRDIIVLFTGDEETAQNGARLAASEWKPLIDAEFALNMDAGGGDIYRDGKPQTFFLQVAEKTYADFTFSTANRGGHSSTPRPDNAIYQLAGALKTLEEYRFAPKLNPASRAYFTGIAAKDGGVFGETIKAWLADPDNLEKADKVEAMTPGYTRTRCVPTQLSGGHARNALPQHAEANVNCRIYPGTRPDEILKELQAIAGKEVKVELTNGGTFSDASPLREDVIAAAQTAVARKFPGVEILPSMSAGATDAVYLRAAGIPTYGAGFLYGYVGESTGTHGNNERVLIRAFHDQIDITEDMLRRLAG